MKQWDAVHVVAEALQADPAVQAIFLKGSIARDEMDDYADVDMYCMVDATQLDAFLPQRMDYLRRYRDIVYHSHANFVGPQIVAVYDNGLHFDLYTVTAQTLQRSDTIRVLYDPNKLLEDYQPIPLALDSAQIVRLVDEFTFMLLEFEAAYGRDDMLWASRLASHLSGNVAMVMRYLADIDTSKLGFKRLYQRLEPSMYQQMYQAMDGCGPSQLPQGAQSLTDLMEQLMDQLPAELQAGIHRDFFHMMSEKIRALS